MNVALFYHSLTSDWNHGNAHFLRGVATALLDRGHHIKIFEPAGAWSRENLVREHGEAPLRAFAAAYPTLRSRHYRADIDLDEALDGVDLVLVHEWNHPDLVARIGQHRARSRRYRALFHDTHHRAVTAPETMAAFDLRDYDGVLAFGAVIRDLYLLRGWTGRAWTWHEAADVRVFSPVADQPRRADVVWIGNWGDDERTAELHELLLRPVSDLGLRATVHGVRYPDGARRAVAAAGLHYAGYLPNYFVPRAFARHRVTLHIPRRPYAAALPGIPTIRPFEALACGIPLISAPWDDVEGLFCGGRDYLVAGDRGAMTRQLRAVLEDEELAASLSASGRHTILTRHTCAHRVAALETIAADLGVPFTNASIDDRGRSAPRRSSEPI
jgi:spore maturation protein CgeB